MKLEEFKQRHIHKTINQFDQLEFLAAIEMFSVIQWLSIDGISVKLVTLEISFV
jgi:hypothetical protein